MDFTVIAQVFEGLKQIATQYQLYLGAFGTFLLLVYGIYQKYQAVMARIALRIEKDTADGTWTNEEKEQEAVDIYFNEILQLMPKMLILLKIVLSQRFIMEPIIRKIVRMICKQAGKIAKRVG